MEYLSAVEGELTDVELDHWAYGPHHLWSYPENGQILRMWQPFNGLQVCQILLYIQGEPLPLGPGLG